MVVPTTWGSTVHMKELDLKSEFDLGWIVGLLEGEGSFLLQGYRSGGPKVTPSIQLAMTDLDVVARAGEFLGGNQEDPKIVRPAGRRTNGEAYKTIYRWRVSGHRAAEVMEQILPHMGERRSARIREILDVWKASKGPKDPKYEALAASLRLPDPTDT